MSNVTLCSGDVDWRLGNVTWVSGNVDWGSGNVDWGISNVILGLKDIIQSLRHIFFIKNISNIIQKTKIIYRKILPNII